VPAALILTRQAWPTLDRTKYAAASGLAQGAYLLALIGRMRVLSSPKIVESAESVAGTIAETYRAPNVTFRDLGDVMSHGAVDPLKSGPP
jgi:transketolase